MGVGSAFKGMRTPGRRNKSHYRASRHSISEEDTFRGPSPFKINKVINPDWAIKRRWDALLVLLVIQNIIFLPLQIAFPKFRDMTEAEVEVIDYVITACFWLDIALTFRTCYYDASLELITDPKLIRWQYLMSMWFYIDLAGVWPWELTLGLFLPPRLTQLGSTLKFFRLLRVNKMLKWLDDIQGVYSTIIRVLRPILTLTVIGHLVGCLFWMVAEYEIEFNNASEDPEDASKYPDEILPWTVDGGYYHSDFDRQYVIALYWSFTTLTTVGYGDISPTTTIETVVVIFIELAGAIVYAIVIGNIGLLVSKLQASSQRYAEKMDSLQEYMRYRNLPIDLQRRIREYHELAWHRLGGYDEEEMLLDLPFNLQHEVADVMHGTFLSKLSHFDNLSTRALTLLINALRPTVCMPQTAVITAGYYGTEVYFLKRGKIELANKQTHTAGLLVDGSPNCYFGVDALLNEPYLMTAKSISYCDMSVLTRGVFQELKQDAPELKEILSKFRFERAQMLTHQRIEEEGEEEEKKQTSKRKGGQKSLRMSTESELMEMLERRSVRITAAVDSLGKSLKEIKEHSEMQEESNGKHTRSVQGIAEEE